MKAASSILAFVPLALFSGCTVLWRQDYLEPATRTLPAERVACDESPLFGPDNGLKIAAGGREVFLCSGMQRGRAWSMGPCLPIFPFARFRFSETRGWIKFGLKPGTSAGPGNSGKTRILLRRVEFQGDSAILISAGLPRVASARRIEKREAEGFGFSIDAGTDMWLGIPVGRPATLVFSVEDSAPVALEWIPASGFFIVPLTI